MRKLNYKRVEKVNGVWSALEMEMMDLKRKGRTVLKTATSQHIIPPNAFNRFYLETKRDRSGHLLDTLGASRLQEQGEVVKVEQP